MPMCLYSVSVILCTLDPHSYLQCHRMKTEGTVKIGQNILKLNSSDYQIVPARYWMACQQFSRKCYDICFIQIVSPANSEGINNKV
jgi:hypothetical protein